MQPADRQQMRQPAAPHRLLVLGRDRAAIARHQRRRDAARRPRNLAMDMLAQPRAQRLARMLGARRQYDIAKHCSDRADAVEPGALRKIIAAGQARGWRRHQPRAHADHRPRHNWAPLVAAQRQPQARWQIGTRERPHDKPQLRARWQRLGGFDPRRKFGRHRPREHRRLDPQRAAPDQQQPCRGNPATDRQGAANAGLPADRQSARRPARKGAKKPDPLRHRRQGEPQRDPGAERHGKPERQPLALGLQARLERRRKRAEP